MSLGLPVSNLTVLFSAKIVAKRTPLFNFEAVYQKYLRNQNNTNLASGLKGCEISRQTFLKIFLDMVRKGFLKSESQVDILSVNNKVAMAMTIDSFENAIQGLPLS